MLWNKRTEASFVGEGNERVIYSFIQLTLIFHLLVTSKLAEKKKNHKKNTSKVDV